MNWQYHQSELPFAPKINTLKFLTKLGHPSARYVAGLASEKPFDLSKQF